MTDASSRTSIAIAPAGCGALVQASDRVLAVASAVNDDADRERFKALLQRHQNLLRGGLSSHYPLDVDLIERFADRWEWGEDGLSRNEALPWSL